MTRKLLICTWFGDLPEWYDDWQANVDRLTRVGYDVFLITDERWWATRAKQTLGVTWPKHADGRKACDYRACFGVMFGRELSLGNYDFWGHTDLDCVYGRVEEFCTEEFLDGVDIYANHFDYVSGPWSLYRNTELVNHAYQQVEDWQGHLTGDVTTGWVETDFTRAVDALAAEGKLRVAYHYWQTQNLNDFSTLTWDGDQLMENGREVMMAHFRRTKVYPEGCR